MFRIEVIPLGFGKTDVRTSSAADCYRFFFTIIGNSVMFRIDQGDG